MRIVRGGGELATGAFINAVSAMRGVVCRPGLLMPGGVKQFPLYVLVPEGRLNTNTDKHCTIALHCTKRRYTHVHFTVRHCSTVEEL